MNHSGKEAWEGGYGGGGGGFHAVTGGSAVKVDSDTKHTA